MMYCATCDAMDMPGKFCSECGGILEERNQPCSNCGEPEAFGPFCHMCGNSLDRQACPNCKASNQNGKFCKKCGYELPISSDLLVAEETTTPTAGSKVQKISNGLGASATVYCRSCYATGRRFKSDGTLVNVCTVCGAPAMYLKFDG